MSYPAFIPPGRLASLLKCLMVILLAGCTDSDQFADLEKFQQEVADRPRGLVAPLPEFETYQVFTYGTANRRSPFEPPMETAGQQRNPDAGNRQKNHLESFPLSAFAMVGSLQNDRAAFALIEDSEGKIHRVQVGDYLGNQWGRIDKIGETRIHLMEIVSDGAGGWLRKPEIIELRRFDQNEH